MTGLQKFLIATAISSLVFLGQSQVEAAKQTAEFLEKRYILTWEVNATDIYMEVVAKTTGYVGLGFNENNYTMDGAELLIGGVKDDNSTYFNLYHGGDHSIGDPKDRNEWTEISITENAETMETTIAISRSLKRVDVTGNSSLFDFESKKIFILYSMAANGEDDPSYHAEARGAVEVNPFDEAPPGGDGGAASLGIQSVISLIALVIVSTFHFTT